MKTILAALIFFAFSCKNNPESRDEEIDQLRVENQQLKEEAAEQKAREDTKNKNLIIQQISEGQGLIIDPDHDEIGFGGINNGSFKLENALSGIVFQTVTVTATVYLANGEVYQSNDFTFTNVKPGDIRTRPIPDTGVKGKRLVVRVTGIRSNWLTNGKPVSI